jgi:hypothetical protein
MAVLIRRCVLTWGAHGSKGSVSKASSGAEGQREEGRGKLGRRREQEGVWVEIRTTIYPVTTLPLPPKMQIY